MTYKTIFLTITTLILCLQSIHSVVSSSYCERDSDCQYNQLCDYYETCDETGCSQSKRKACQAQITTEQKVLIQSHAKMYSHEEPSLTIRSREGKDSFIEFEKKYSNTSDHFKVGLEDSSSNFVFNKGDSNLMTINSKHTNISNNLIIGGTLNLGEHTRLKVNGFNQWMMIHEESGGDFETQSWTFLQSPGMAVNITNCSGVQMLGGYGILSDHKLITLIPMGKYNYSQVKVQATFHFIDAWAGQTAYLRLPKGDVYLWTDSFDFTLTKNSLNLCGTDVGEGKFSALVESVFNPELGLLSDGTLMLEFGTTLDTDPLYSSYGISELRVYVR